MHESTPSSSCLLGAPCSLLTYRADITCPGPALLLVVCHAFTCRTWRRHAYGTLTAVVAAGLHAKKYFLTTTQPKRKSSKLHEFANAIAAEEIASRHCSAGPKHCRAALSAGNDSVAASDAAVSRPGSTPQVLGELANDVSNSGSICR